MRWLRSRPATPELCDPPAATGVLDGACDPSAEAAGAMPAAVAGQKLAEEEEERHRLALAHLGTLQRRVASDLSPLSESEQRFLSEETLLRYLRARDGNEQLAFSMLEATLAWRRRHIAPACGEGGGLPRCEACEARVAEMPCRDVPAGWPSGCI
uniref:CRAL/TRIO N-terminal domain-containing protein n=1 Tax=Emiliania huxleyi TaxID=2903 RepID=A0A7S3TGG2_EMIHU